MSEGLHTKAAPAPALIPVQTTLLQNRRTFSESPRLVLQRRTPTTLPIVYEMSGSPGEPIDPGTRDFFEPRFGHDFGRVRVHADEKAIHVQSIAMQAKLWINQPDDIYEQEADRVAEQMVSSKPLQRHDFNKGQNLIQRFSEKPHEEIENSAFGVPGSLFSENERKQIALGNWQNDFNQISLAIPYLEKTGTGINLTKDDCFEIANIIAEEKFGPEIARQMNKNRFGEYEAKQHFDNPLKPNKELGNEAVPDYINENIVFVEEVFQKAIDAKKDKNSAVAMEYFGSALHIMEDFFAHSNFVEIALNKKKRFDCLADGGRN